MALPLIVVISASLTYISAPQDEVAHWISPEDFDAAEAEADHLLYNADMNKDKKLTKEEVLENMKFFVGSQATDYGNYLTRHDEF